MGPNKFEKHIKKQLREREIKPSENTWDRISEQLVVSERPAIRPFYWYGIAAGFIGLLFISGWYFSEEKSPVSPPAVVIEPLNYPPKKESNTGILQKTEEDIAAEAVVTNEEVVPEKTTEKVAGPDSAINILAPVVEKSNEPIEKVSIASNNPEEVIATKIAEIADQVAKLEHENNSVTDAEIDALLRKAQHEILEDRIVRRNHSIDATALLADVEEELDQSFRDQIFGALKEGYFKVRTAVADRNK